MKQHYAVRELHTVTHVPCAYSVLLRATYATTANHSDHSSHSVCKSKIYAANYALIYSRNPHSA
jgi:hypothetical protein